MPTQQRTVEFILEQIASAGQISARKMFGEYGIYCDGKIVALVCDDHLFVKPTIAGRAYIGEIVEGAPYKGAKPWFVIPGDTWDDGDWLAGLIRTSAAELPLPIKKRRSK